MDEFEQFLKQQPLRQVSPDWRSELLRAAESVRPATPFQRWRRWSTLAAAAALAAMIGGGALYLIRRQQPTPAGRIAELVGSAEVRVGDKAKPMAAKPGMALCDGSRVLTGDGNSRCRLALATGDVVVTVMASSEVILKGGRADRQYDSEVNMTRGELEAEVRRKGTRFAVASVAGKAEAIGTRFKVKLQETTEAKESTMNHSQISMLTTVLSGVVLISNPFGAMEARAGEAVTATATTVPASTATKHEGLHKGDTEYKMDCVGKLTARTNDVYFLTLSEGERTVYRLETFASEEVHKKVHAFVGKKVRVGIKEIICRQKPQAKIFYIVETIEEIGE